MRNIANFQYACPKKATIHLICGWISLGHWLPTHPFKGHPTGAHLGPESTSVAGRNAPMQLWNRYIIMGI